MAFLMSLLRRILGCRHRQTLREHRADGWYWVCACGASGLLNPRDKAAPQPIGTFNAAKLSHAQSQAAKEQTQRQKLAAKRSRVTFPPDVRKLKAVQDETIRPFRKVSER